MSTHLHKSKDNYSRLREEIMPKPLKKSVLSREGGERKATRAAWLEPVAKLRSEREEGPDREGPAINTGLLYTRCKTNRGFKQKSKITLHVIWKNRYSFSMETDSRMSRWKRRDQVRLLTNTKANDKLVRRETDEKYLDSGYILKTEMKELRTKRMCDYLNHKPKSFPLCNMMKNIDFYSDR